MPALRIFAPDTGEAMTKISAIQQGISHLADHGSPMSMGFGATLVLEPLEAVTIVFYQAVQRQGLRISRSIDSAGLLLHALLNEGACRFAILFRMIVGRNKHHSCSLTQEGLKG